MSRNTKTLMAIEIPAGEDFIDAPDIPYWIAQRVEPVPKTLPMLVDLKKQILHPEAFSHQHEDLTDADLALLCEIWQGIPDRKLPYGTVTTAEYAEYRRVFEESSKKPEWDLAAAFRDYQAEAQVRQGNAHRAQRDQMNIAIRDGLRVLTAHRVPATQLERGAVISVADARAYLKPLGFELVEAKEPAEANAPAAQAIEAPPEVKPEAGGNEAQDEGRDGNGGTWQDKAREIADELHRKDLKAGAWSSNRDISERVASEAFKRNIVGPTGKLTAGNVLREALQGKRWKRPST